MSVTVSSVENGRSLSTFLARSTPEASSRGGGADAFSEALRQSLAGLGVEPEQVSVSVSPTPAALTGSEARSFVVTVGPPPASHGCGGDSSVSPPGVETGPEELPSSTQSPGQHISRDQWTEELLTGYLSAQDLRSVEDPAGLLNARCDQLRQPTKAQVVGPQYGGPSPINSSFLSTREQAEGVRQRMLDLGLDVGEVQEQGLGGGPYEMNWADEERRVYTIDGSCVGLILEQYARNTTEYVDQLLVDRLTA